MIKLIPGHVWLNIKTRLKYRVLGVGADDFGEHFAIYQAAEIPVNQEFRLLYVLHSETLQPGLAILDACGGWRVEWGVVEPDLDNLVWVRPLWMWKKKFRLLVKWEGKEQFPGDFVN